MRILALTSLALAVIACGDNYSHDHGDAAPVDTAIDAIPPDADCPARPQGMVGGPCTASSQCDSVPNAGDGLCLTGNQGGIFWPASGYCVNKLGTCTDNASCGAGNVCATINDPGGAFPACLPACGSGACACSNGQLCGDNLTGSVVTPMACIPGNPAAVDGDPCSGFGECDEGSICRVDAAEFPGGQCMQIGCTIGNDATCTSGGTDHCIDPGFIAPGSGCVKTCTSNGDCRQTEGYVCFDGGGTAGKYCRHPQTGDACATATDCGDALWTCKTGAPFTGGYCTLAAACPTPGAGDNCTAGQSICWDNALPAATDNICVDRCPNSEIGTRGRCRTGYTCTDVDPVGGPTHIFGGCTPN